MVLGEELHSGGKALESDILRKKLAVFKTLGNHIQDIGLRIRASQQLLSTPTSVGMYTVPTNKVAYLTYMQLAGSNATANHVTTSIEITPSGTLFPDLMWLSLPTGESPVSDSLSFANPIKLFQNEELVLTKSAGGTDIRVGAVMILYEVDKEISIQ